MVEGKGPWTDQDSRRVQSSRGSLTFRKEPSLPTGRDWARIPVASWWPCCAQHLCKIPSCAGIQLEGGVENLLCCLMSSHTLIYNRLQEL